VAAPIEDALRAARISADAVDHVNAHGTDVVANEARRVSISCGVSTSLAFGGNDAALVMRRVNA